MSIVLFSFKFRRKLAKNYVFSAYLQGYRFSQPTKQQRISIDIGKIITLTHHIASNTILIYYLHPVKLATKNSAIIRRATKRFLPSSTVPVDFPIFLQTRKFQQQLRMTYKLKTTSRATYSTSSAQGARQQGSTPILAN